MKTILPFYPALFVLLLSGCAQNVDGTWKAPFVYRIDVQQGNVVDQEMLDKLKPGMDKNQVKFILGSPLIADPFHSNRWDYVYSFEPGRGERQQRRVTIYFKDDKLSHVEGDIQAVERVVTEDLARPKERSVDVPLERYEEGFFSKMFSRDDDKTGLSEPDDTATADTPTEDAAPSEPDASATVTETAASEATAAETAIGSEPLPEGQPRSLAPSSETEVTSSQTARGSTLESDQDKNLLRRFWDRMTTSESQSGVEDGEETERDLRDAEVFEDAGGEL